MSDDLNLSERPETLRWDLITSYKRVSFLGWFLFIVTLLLLILQTAYYSIKVHPVMASENGKVIGQVIFDEPRLRMPSEILSDMRNVVRKCSSADKENIWDDMAVCFSHMNPKLAEASMSMYEQSGELLTIESYGCQDVEHDFDPEETKIKNHNPNDYLVEAVIAGTVSCNDDPENVLSDSFKVVITSVLVPKNTARSYGLEIIKYENI